MEAFVGTILPVGFNFAPLGWLPCDGRLLPISEYDVLFTLIGTSYGGDGQTTFGLPDLRGRVPVGYGQGPSQPNYLIGQKGGQMEATLTSANLPVHNHLLRVGTASTTNVPANNYLANAVDDSQNPLLAYVSDAGDATGTWNPLALTAAGASIPVDTMAPYQVINYVIATAGIFPQQQ